LGELVEGVMLFSRENQPLRPFKGFITPESLGKRCRKRSYSKEEQYATINERICPFSK
jgi:hypothetical protein